MFRTHPGAELAVGLAALIASGLGCFYSILAVGVSDGPGHLTAQLMLGGSIVAIFGATAIIWRASSALLARL